MTLKTKKRLLLGLGLLLVLGIAAGARVWQRQGPVLQEIAKDLRAGVQSRHAPKPFERYLELRYGSMDNSTNREAAFLSFFNPAHLEGMYRMVRHMKVEERQKNISATAEWLAGYRENLSAAERAALAEWVQSPAGKEQVRQATSLYLKRDIAYRSSTEPVVRELMATLAEVQQP